MKKTFLIGLCACICMILSAESVAQTITPEPSNFESFIRQVYVAQGQSQIAPDTRRYAYMKELYLNRITYVAYDPVKIKALKYTKLSQMPINDTYNKGLSRDVTFDVNTFNPFKYKINYYKKETQRFLIDNSNYVMIIRPQQPTK